MSVNSFPWYYSPSLATTGERVLLSGDEWHHCHQVLRMGPGDALILFDGLGQCMEGVIRNVSRHEGEIELISDQRLTFHHPRAYRISLAFAPTKNMDRTEFAVEKLTELGVDEIIFLDCDHGERTRIRMDRIEKIIRGAAKQSRKIRLPEIRDFIAPTLLVTQSRRDQPEVPVFCCHLESGSLPLTDNYHPGQSVLMLIGPEGGFALEEVEQMKLRGATTITLGPFRLRVETAAIAACAAIHTLNDLK